MEASVIKTLCDDGLTEAPFLQASLGLWSAAGVDEGRQLFWRSFEAGKVPPPASCALCSLICSEEHTCQYTM